MAVAYDNSVTVHGFGVTTLTTGSFTIGGTNRAGVIGFNFLGTVTSLTASVGGATAALVSGTDSSLLSGVDVQLWGAAAPATGSQTATASWTTAVSCSLGVITAQGVDQTTPLNNGTTANNAFATTTPNLSITSTNGDLTTSVLGTGNSDTAGAVVNANQTKKTTDWGSMDIGDGTGTQSHQWSDSIQPMIISGANFKAVAVSGSVEWRQPISQPTNHFRPDIVSN